ncbi:MAG: helicase-associated domain-containing protein [Ardenticatenaceae bacterium]|nr:helicase-associated domain-containing protein [Ardenticatenaceae bacterium]
MSQEILNLLDTYNSNNLWEMAREANLPGTTGVKLKKAQLLKLMQEEYFKPQRIKADYERLPEREKAIINRLLLHKGSVSTRTFGRELLRAGLVTEAQEESGGREQWSYGRYQTGPTADPHNHNSTVFEDIIARLTLHGLVFSTDAANNTGGTSYKLQYHPANTLIVPPFVRQHLPPAQPLVVDKREWQPPHIAHGDPQLFLRDLYLYWDAVRRSPIAMIQAGFVGKRGLKSLNDVLLNPDPSLENARQEDQTSRLYLLRQLLEGLQLIRPFDGQLQITADNSRTIPTFWQKSTAEQVQQSLQVWRRLNQPVTLANPQNNQYNPHTRTACQLLWTILEEMPAATWIEAQDLLGALQDRNEDFLFESRSRIVSNRSYYYNYGYYGDPKKILKDMDDLETQFVAEVMAGLLFQAGLVELGYKSAAAPPHLWRTFRFTPLGQYIFQHNQTAPAEAEGQIIIQPNFQILAMGPVGLNLLAQIDLFAERQKVDRTAFQYQLTRESVYAAQQANYSVDDVQRFLDTVTPHDLPQNIRRSLAEWGAHHERIVFRRQVTLLQAATPELLQELRHDAQTGRCLDSSEMGTAVALLKPRQQDKLVETLQAKGLFPAISGANPQSADNSVIIHKDGRIQPIHAVPSLYLSGRLARFSQQTAVGWQLTEKSISRAGGSKKKVQTILDELHKLHRGPFPPDLIEQLKAWGGYYGSATIGTYTLIEFINHDILGELLKHPQLKDVLQPFAAGERAITAVPAAKLPQVQAILTQLGIKITEIGD